MYMKMYIKPERFYQQLENQPLKEEKCYSDYDEELEDREGGGGAARRCARDAAASPAHPAHLVHPAHPAPLPPLVPLPPPTHVKTERLSPHDNTSSASRSRSVTPSTSSYPATPPSRGSPHAPAPSAPAAAASAPGPAPPPRNYSDIMRSLAARYNTQHPSDYFHRLNGFGPVEPRASAQTSPLRTENTETQVGGLFTRLLRHPGGPQKMPAFPLMVDMTSTKTLLAIARVGRYGRARRKRTAASSTSSGAEHSPLDLSAASETAAKRARLSISPMRSDCDERDRGSSDDRGDCLCAEARARLQAWTVDDVCDFVNSIDICAEYTSNFREQRIDGAGLPLLTEDHLTGMLQMKLGPALKLRAVLGRKLEPCANCLANNIANNGTNIGPRINGSSLKSEPRSNTTSPS